jgi:hypothetical protein
MPHVSLDRFDGSAVIQYNMQHPGPNVASHKAAWQIDSTRIAHHNALANHDLLIGFSQLGAQPVLLNSSWPATMQKAARVGRNGFR